MSDISIMTATPADRGTGPPAILVADDGAWRELEPGATVVDTGEVRRQFNGALSVAARAVDQQGAGNAVDGLKLGATMLFKAVVPPELAKMLAAALAAAEPGEAPQLRIHVRPEHEWIPWETLWAGGCGFLGLSFRIARLPVLPRPARVVNSNPHQVAAVSNVLGQKVVAEGNGEFDVWSKTFEDLLPDGVQLTTLPAAFDAQQEWPQNSALAVEADILHVTCHGQQDEQKGAFWTLAPDSPDLGFMFRFGELEIEAAAEFFGATRPLVFGNACATRDAAAQNDANERPPLARAFFRSGATNFVGSVAPIRKETALKFARTFYTALLGEGQEIGAALLHAKQRCSEDPAVSRDPSYLFYCLYGPPDTTYAGSGNGGG